MFCSKCGTQNDGNSKFCIGCGAKLNANSSEPVTINNSISVNTQVSPAPTKQICLICKGKGKRVNRLHLAIALILGLIVFPAIAFATGGVALIASAIVIFWGVSKKECKTCKGNGHITM